MLALLVLKETEVKFPDHNILKTRLPDDNGLLELKNSDFFVGNNSGPLNLSAALGVKSFGLIANDPIDELKYSKIQIITPENYDNVRDRNREGMKKLTVERVFKQIIELSLIHI